LSAGPTSGSAAQVAATVLYGVALLVGVAVLLRRGRDPKLRRRSLLALTGFIAPAAAMAALIALRSDYHPRYFMAVIPAYIVIVAIGAGSLPHRLPVVAASVLALAAVPGLRAMYTDPAVQKQDYREIIGTVEAAGPWQGSALLLDGPPFGMVQRYRTEDSKVKIVNLQRSDFLDLDSEQLTAAIVERVAPYHDVWLATDGQSWGAGTAWVVGHCFPVVQQSIQDVTLGRYWRELQAGDVPTSPAQPLVLPAPVQLSVGMPEHDRDGVVLPLVLEWRVEPPADLVRRRDWSVSVRLLGPGGEVRSSADRAPLLGTRPTSTWMPGESVIDRQALYVPDEIGPGPYPVEVLLYDPLTLEPIGQWRWESRP